MAQNEGIAAYRLVKQQVASAVAGEAMPSIKGPEWAELVLALRTILEYGDDATRSALLGIGMQAVGALLERAMLSGKAERELLADHEDRFLFGRGEPPRQWLC